MTVEEVKEKLSQAFTIDKEVQAYKEQIANLKAAATNISPLISDDIQGKGRTSDMVGENVTKMVELQYKYIDKVADLLALQDEIQAMIDTLEDGRHRTVMTERYILLKGWKDVVDSVNYSETHVTDLHKEAIEILGGVKNERSRKSCNIL